MDSHHEWKIFGICLPGLVEGVATSERLEERTLAEVVKKYQRAPIAEYLNKSSQNLCTQKIYMKKQSTTMVYQKVEVEQEGKGPHVNLKDGIGNGLTYTRPPLLWDLVLVFPNLMICTNQCR